MEPKPTISNVDELITSYIDGQGLDKESESHIERLIASDESVSNKYRSEKLTKELFASKLQMVEVPAQTYERVNSAIDDLIANSVKSPSPVILHEHESFFLYLKNFFISPLSIGRFALPRYAYIITFVVLVIGLGFFLTRNSNDINPFYANGSDKSVMVQAVNNFHKLMNGEIKPTMKSSDVKEVSNYVAANSKFDAYIPDIEDYKLIGVVTNEFDGKKLAHFIYASGDKLIYIYETCMDSICGKKLEIPTEMHNQVVKNKYYLCDKFDDKDCSFMMWYRNNVLCASVSNMPKQTMQTKFASFYK